MKKKTLEELFKKEYIFMGVLNVTPDSFSDGGMYLNLEKALLHVEKMISEGADIIDIGGESSRPGAEPVSEKEELRRVLPIIKAVRNKFPQILISVDTYKSSVAKASIEAGADIINDISAMRFDDNMVKVVKKYNTPVVLMHMKGTPRNMQKNPQYKDVVAELMDFFSERINFALKNGIKKENIIIDPGIGFGKNLEHNLSILKNIDKFLKFNVPVLLGASRKSYIGMITNENNPQKRIYGTIATNLFAFSKGIKFFRIHDIYEHKQALDVFIAINKV